LIRAGKWLDASPENRKQAAEILSKPEYVGADFKVIANSMTGTWEYHKGDVRPMPDFNVFFRYHATYPFYSDAIWYLTQMRRWGQITEAKSDDWYLNTAKEVYKPDTYLKAAALLIKEGKLKEDEIPQTDGFKAPTSDFIDGIEYDGTKPNEYLKKFPIGLKD
jgi:nitrate/nitrite transport system substrate-binding protein